MQLILLHPEVAFRDCAHCLEHVYDESIGKLMYHRGQPLKRMAGIKPPCQTAKGCPKGSPTASVALSERNQQAYDHYQRCRAVGKFPEDPIVEENAALIRYVEDQVAALEHQRLITAVMLGGKR